MMVNVLQWKFKDCIVFLVDFSESTVWFNRLMQTDKYNNKRKEVMLLYKATSQMSMKLRQISNKPFIKT